MRTCIATQSKPRQWKPDTPLTVTDMLHFDKVSPGQYTLAVGLVRDHKKDPDIKLGIELPVRDGWYQLGQTDVR